MNLDGSAMAHQNRIIPRWLDNPKCLLCDALTESMVIYDGDNFTIRGWKCPECGLTLIHPNDIPKALELLRETAKI